MSDLNFTLDITSRKFVVTIDGEIDDIDALETDVFQPAVADQLVGAIRAKLDARAARSEGDVK